MIINYQSNYLRLLKVRFISFKTSIQNTKEINIQERRKKKTNNK